MADTSGRYYSTAKSVYACPNVSATPIRQMGLKMGGFPFGNGVCLIMKKPPPDSLICQLKKRELLLPLCFLITKPIKLELSNLHYRPHYEPHYIKEHYLSKIT